MISALTFHHIGIATKNIELTAAFYIQAGYRMSDIIIEPVQQVKIAFLSKSGMPLLELIAPLDNNNSVVNNYLQKTGTGPYHFCYCVTDLDAAIKEFKAQKYILLSNPVEAIAFNNRKICFLYNKNVGLVELLEEEKA